MKGKKKENIPKARSKGKTKQQGRNGRKQRGGTMEVEEGRIQEKRMEEGGQNSIYKEMQNMEQPV